MKPRHVAALALVGWYLMRPAPAEKERASEREEPNSPARTPTGKKGAKPSQRLIFDKQLIAGLFELETFKYAARSLTVMR
jgi:hypothetical protein